MLRYLAPDSAKVLRPLVQELVALGLKHPPKEALEEEVSEPEFPISTPERREFFISADRQE